MRRKVKGTILLIVGLYLGFVNTTIILLLPFYPHIPYSPDPLDPITYWRLWFMQYGWQAILSAVIGLSLLTLGIRYFVIKKEKVDSI